MKRTLQKIHGVTLLEIMLVLAVAAMVVVMSIKYYQSANMGQQANALTSQIQAISAAADGIAQSTSSYASANSAAILTVLGPNGLKTPFNTTATITTAATSITVTVPSVPPQVCGQISVRLKGNPNYSVTACGSTTGNLVYSYHP